MTTDARPGVRAAVEPWISLVLAASTLTQVLFFVDRGLGRSSNPLAVGGWWWLRIALFDLVAVAAIWLLVALLSRLVPRFRLVRVTLVTISLAFFGVVPLVNLWVLRTSPLVQNPSGARWPLAALVLSVLAGLLVPIDSRRARLVRRGALAGSIVAMVVTLQPRVNPSIASAPEPVQPEAGSHPSERLLVLGLDGADWLVLDQLFARGLAPNLARLRSQGAWGDLATLRPTQSPPIWTTIATGRSPADHGVLGHTVERPRGLDIGSPAGRFRVRGLGLLQLRRWLRRSGQLVEGPVTGAERRVPAFWNITTHFGRPLSVVSWWATWPAEPILGRMVSDRVFYDRARARGATDASDDRLTFPDELAARLRRLAFRPDQVDYETAREFLNVSREEYDTFSSLPYGHHEIRSEFQLYYAMFRSDVRFALELMRLDEAAGRQPTDEMFLTRFIDHASHCCLKYSNLVEDHLGMSAEDISRFGLVTERAYLAVDAAVGEIVERFGRGNVLILSDHGFRRELGPGDVPRYHHESAPPGIFLASGPNIRPGRIEGLSVYDMLPLMLSLKALPIARDLPGRVPIEILAGSPEGPPPIPSYDFLLRAPVTSRGSRSDAEIMEELRALGYLQ